MSAGNGFLILDTETSGLFDWSLPADAPGQPRLASIALLFVDGDLEIERRHYDLVRPDGWEMSAEAQALNGLSQERLLAEGVDVKAVLELFDGALRSGLTLVAHNLAFDAKVMRGELRRAGLSDEHCRAGICTMRDLTQTCAIAGPRGLKWPKLEEACRIVLGREIAGAHNALVDAKACLWLLRAMHERGLLATSNAA